VCGQQPQQQQQQQQQPGADAVGWAQGWRCSWELLQPRTRSPAGRCHHSCCWHADSRSVVVFGGYASMRGCLGDVQVYSVDHREWLAPAQTGG
jgi:hypothetical protein